MYNYIIFYKINNSSVDDVSCRNIEIVRGVIVVVVMVVPQRVGVGGESMDNSTVVDHQYRLVLVHEGVGVGDQYGEVVRHIGSKMACLEVGRGRDQYW